MTNKKLIIDFIDGVIIGDRVHFPDVKIEGGGQITHSKPLTDINFKRDWNHLMVVVDEVSIFAQENNLDHGLAAYMFLTNDIDSVYHEVVKFIRENYEPRN